MIFDVQVGECVVVMSERELLRAWWETADLHDTDHAGPAAVLVGPNTLDLNEEQWRSLYVATSIHLERGFWADITEDEVLIAH